MNKKINWYINRFKAMSSVELVWRINAKVHVKLQKFLLFLFGSPLDRKRWKSIEKEIFSRKESFLEKFKNLFLENNENDIKIMFRKIFPESEKNIEEKAEAILRHEFSFSDGSKVSLGKKINWHLDYKTGKEWPKKFWNDIDFKNNGSFGIKYVWELNRHQHLPLLGIAYFLTEKDKYAVEAFSQLKDWMEENPPYYGVNWASPLELSIRIILWIITLSFIGNYRYLENEILSDVIKYIFLQAEYINRYLSKYSSANNHLIGEAAGLFISGIVLKDFKNSTGWIRRGYKILIEEIDKQTYGDGVNKEQAFSYQSLVLDFFLLSGFLGEKTGIEFPDSYWRNVEKMIGFLFSVMDYKGNVPYVGDSGVGYVIRLNGSKSFNNYRSLLVNGAVLFRRADFKYKAQDFDEKSFWLLGQESKKKFDDLSVKSKDIKSLSQSQAFPEGGYYVFRSEQDKNEILMIFDCGPLGYLSIAAHGHADALSFILNVGGNPIFTDSGIYEYHSKIKWRDYFRGTSAHNTIRIDREDQSVSGGAFLWQRKAEASIKFYEFTEQYDIVRGYHNGYSRFKDPVVHEREIFFDKLKNVFVIEDFLKAKGNHFLEQFFHLDKECKIEKLKKNCLVIKSNGYYCYLLNDSEDWEFYLLKGSSDPILGWQSKKFGVKHPTWSVRGEKNFEGEIKLLTFVFISFESQKIESILNRKEEVLITRAKVQKK